MNNQETLEMRLYRHQQIQMAMFRKNHKCDICGRWASDYHECIYRSQTMNNQEARRLSFQQELCAILCPGCHSNAHTETMSLQLLKRNILVYGYDSVEEALALVQAELRGQVMLIMPKRNDVHG